MDNAEFIRKQLIILGVCIPACYALLSFPFTLLALIYLSAKPLYGLGSLTAIIGYVMLGRTAWIRKSLTWTFLFLLISSTPLLWHFVVVP